MTNDLPTRLLAAIQEAETDAKDARYRLQCRVAFSIGVERGQTSETMAAGLIWEPLLAEARSVIGDAVHEDPHEATLRFCQAHLEIVELHMVLRADYDLAAEKRATATTVFPPKLMELEAAVTAAIARLQLSEHWLSILASAYGLEESP